MRIQQSAPSHPRRAGIRLHTALDEFVAPEDRGLHGGPVGRDTPLDINADILACGRIGRAFSGVGPSELFVREDDTGARRFDGEARSLHDLLFGFVLTARRLDTG